MQRDTQNALPLASLYYSLLNLKSNQMKKSLLVLLVAFTATLVSAQRGANRNNDVDETTETFLRKGRILIETGYNLVGGLPIGGGSGLTTISDGENSFSGIGFNGGYFVSQNFALKLNYSNLGDGGNSISSFGIGAKYYIAGKVPIDFSLGTFSGGGDSEGYGTLAIGYGVKLAENINLEPSLGFFGNSDDAITTFSLNFAMFL